MKTFTKQVIAVIALVAVIAASFPFAAPGMAETNAAVQPDEIWDGSIAEGFAGGTGTEADPYLISNGAELAYLAQQTNSGISYQGSYFALTNDIYLNDTTDWESWSGENAPANEWIAIGTGYWESDYSEFKYPFSGSFDGNGHAVHGVYINEPESDYLGLFGYNKNIASIANVGVSESYIYGGAYVGGVVGDNDGRVSNCYNTGSVTGRENVGGVIGGHWYGEASDCRNTGNVAGRINVGGVAGGNWYGEIVNCCNSGSVTGITDATGSVYIAGVVGSNGLGGVSGCYNIGSVTGDYYVGGVVGESYGNGEAVISNCYNTGSVTGLGCVGGVIGNNDFGSETSNCYNNGSVTCSDSVGAVAGVNSGTVTSCYYIDTSCESGDGYATALTDEQMREADSFIGFDFNEVWTMEGNAEYPYPELISNPHMGLAMPGDLDGDGVITVVDANAALRIALELEDFNPIGDVDSDGAVTLADANAILRLALGL